MILCIDVKVTNTISNRIFINRHIMDSLLDFGPVNEGIVKLGLNLHITI